VVGRQDDAEAVVGLSLRAASCTTCFWCVSDPNGKARYWHGTDSIGNQSCADQSVMGH
jgi:hypothetical protein